MQINILFLGLFLSLGIIWFGLNLDTTRLIRRSDRASDGQKKLQIALTWAIPGFFYLARRMHLDFEKEEAARNWAHPPTRSGGNASALAWADAGWDPGLSAGSYAVADHGCGGSDGSGDCGAGD